MFKKILLLLVVIGIGFSFKTNNKDSNPKIIVDYKIGINYVTHLYTLADLGFGDKEYVEKYSFSVPEEDISLLKKNSKFLEFGCGASGNFTSFLFFTPAFADLKSKSEYEQYFQDIDSAINNKIYGPIDKYIPVEKKEDAQGMFLLNDDQWKNVLAVNPIFNEIAKVYLNNIDTYLNEVYPQIKPELKDKAKRLNRLIKNNSIINDWQKATNYKWDYGNYTFLLFKAGKYGPSFNDLSKNFNTFYYKINDAHAVNMLSHEFGVFLMRDSVGPVAREMGKLYPAYKNEITLGRVNWMAAEMLSTYFNCKINDRKMQDYFTFYHSDPIAFFEIYDKLYKSGVTNPKEMYRKAIKEYMKSETGYWNNGVEERYKQLRKEKNKSKTTHNK